VAGELLLTAIYETVEGDWVQGRIQELPEVITAAPTRAEAEEALKDAVLEYLASLSEPLNGDSLKGDRQSLQLTVSA
jgi:predicted RNase H-like HicB family nuclease